jgi:hypothetical protein
MSTFYLDYNVSGPERKRLVKAIATYTQTDAKYLGAPTFAYQVDYFTIDRNGVVSFDDRADSEEIEGLIDVLFGQGFVAQVSDRNIPTAESEESEQASEEPATEPDSTTTEPTASEAPVDTEETGLTISLPLDGFNPDSLDRLQKLIGSKASLIKKALSADQLTVKVVDDTVCFPWWDAFPIPEEIAAYSTFLAALCKMAKEAKRVTGKDKPVENEKYAFRCFLLRLGFIGDDYKQSRKILLQNFSGSSAWKSGTPTKEVQA